MALAAKRYLRVIQIPAGDLRFVMINSVENELWRNLIVSAYFQTTTNKFEYLSVCNQVTDPAATCVL